MGSLELRMADLTLNIYMNSLVMYIHRIAFTAFSLEPSYNLLFCIHLQVILLYSIDSPTIII